MRSVRHRKQDMAISGKTRKILWGRSANRCAFCRHELVIDASAADDDSIVGEECHIVSGKIEGPRHDPALAPERVDDADNLILLCRIHHKMVDDQSATYSVSELQRLKADHEKWVASTLTERKEIPPVRLRRIKGNIPSHLVRVTSGQDVMKFVGRSSAFSFDHDEPHSEAEVDLLSGFLQEAQDWGDLSSDLEAGDRVKAAYRMGTLLQELADAGFWVFGGQEVQRLEGGVGGPSSFEVAILHVVRTTNPAIIHFGEQTDKSQDEQSMVSKNAVPETSGGDV